MVLAAQDAAVRDQWMNACKQIVAEKSAIQKRSQIQGWSVEQIFGNRVTGRACHRPCCISPVYQVCVTGIKSIKQRLVH